MPDTQTEEKIDTLLSIGANLKLVPAKPYKDPDNFVKYSGRFSSRNFKRKYNGNTNMG